jgi:hypothetical protein
VSGRESRWRALVVCVVVLGAGAAAIAWLVHERDGASLESKLRAMSPEVVGSPPTVKWHRRLICQGEKLAVMCVGDAGATGGDAYYLKTTINLRPGNGPAIGIINLLSMFLGSDTHAIVCRPPAADGNSRCAAMPTDASPEMTAHLETFELPIESAVYLR